MGNQLLLFLLGRPVGYFPYKTDFSFIPVSILWTLIVFQGKFWQTMGVCEGGLQLLDPEEALFLMDIVSKV